MFGSLRSIRSQGVSEKDLPATIVAKKKELDDRRKRITAATNFLDSNDKFWLERIAERRTFLHSFAEQYPIATDETATAAREFAENTNKQWKTLSAILSDPSEKTMPKHRVLQRQLQLFLSEVGRLDEDYKQIRTVRHELGNHERRMENLRKKHAAGGHPLTIAERTLTSEKARYEALIQRVTATQTQLQTDSSHALRAALDAMRESYAFHTRMAKQGLEQTSDYFLAIENDLADVSVESLAPFDLSILDGLSAESA